MSDKGELEPTDGGASWNKYDDDFYTSHVLDDSDSTEYEFEDRLRDDAYDLKSQFRAARRAIHDCEGDFQRSGDTLYDFLYKFRDIASQVDDDMGTLLHIAVEFARDNPSVETINMKPLIQNLLKEHPHLLSARDRQSQTPLYIAILIKDSHLIEAMTDDCTNYPQWEFELKAALDIECVSQGGKTCLHTAFERNLRPKSIETLIRFSSDEALKIRDSAGMTPLHYAVEYKDCTDVRTKLIILLIAKDEAATKKSGNTFLDIVDFNGKSVYQRHLESKERYLRRLRQTEPNIMKMEKQSSLEATRKMPEKSTPNKSIIPYKEKEPILKRYKEPIAKFGESSDSLQKGHKDNLYIKRLPDSRIKRANTPSQPDDTEDDKKLGHKERALRGFKMTPEMLKRNSDIICHRLKLQYMRTRNVEMVISFLHGKNLNDAQMTFDYQGLPLEISDHVFQRAFELLNFDSVLQYVSFPRNIKVQRTGQKTLRDNNDVSLGRHDMDFFFRWLRDKGVRHIINLHVDDMAMPSHSDEAIIHCLEGITVENLDWGKVDLDPRTILQLGEARGLRNVSLHWSGNNTALRAWSEPEGLPMLKKLTKINLYIPSYSEMIDSKSCVERNLEEFRHRLLQNSEKISGNQKNIEIAIVQTNGNEPSRKITLSGRASAIENVAAAPRWLDCVMLFGSLVEKVLSSMRGNFGQTTDKKTVVALIDDGVDVIDPLISDHIVGGRSFAYSDNKTKPYYVSEFGHGTAIANTILKVCPMAQIYPIRIDTAPSEDGRAQINVKSAALAIQTALDKETAIILMPWCIPFSKNTGEEQELEAVLRRARDTGVLIFCPSPDIDGSRPTDYYPAPYGRNSIFQIGAAKSNGETNGENMEWSRLVDNVDFIFPGDEVIKRNSENPQISGEENVNTPTASVSGSSVAAALGASLAAIIIYCYEVAELTKEADEDLKRHFTSPFSMRKITEHANMMNAFRSLGTITPHKFINVWESLDPIIRNLENPERPEKEKFMDIVDFCLIISRDR